MTRFGNNRDGGGLFLLSALTVIILVSSIPASAEDPPPISLDLQIAPNVLNLSNQGTVVTIHTNYPYDQFDVSKPAGVFVGDGSGSYVPINWWKADLRGDFVAKFEMDAVQGAVASLGLPMGSSCSIVFKATSVNNAVLGGAVDVTIVDRKSR
mgnify:CR=1 FL=1